MRWTEHETATPTPVAPGTVGPVPVEQAPVGPAPVAPVPQAASGSVAARAPAGRPPGWYPTPAGPFRWWDGSVWTGLRVVDGVPGIDWATAERPGAAWVFGSLFALLAVVQFSLGLVTPGAAFSGAAMLLLAVLWFAIAAKSSAVRRIPPPSTDAVVIDAVLPLPGSAEGPGAGWYPVTPTVTRWWTGSRWAQYTGTAYGVRPTFHGARSWRNFRILLWSILGLGVVVLLVGIVLAVVGSADPGSDPLLVVVGVMTAIGGVVFAGMAGLLFAFSGRQRRVLLLPETGPSGVPLADPRATAAR